MKLVYINKCTVQLMNLTLMLQNAKSCFLMLKKLVIRAQRSNG